MGRAPATAASTFRTATSVSLGTPQRRRSTTPVLTSTEFMVCTWPITCGSCRRMMLPSMPSTSPCTSRPPRGQMRSRGMYEEAHAAILKDASRAPVPAEKKHAHLKAKHPLQVKLSKAQRDQRVANKKVYKAYKVWKDDQ